MNVGGRWRNGEPSVAPQEVIDEIEAGLDGYQADLEAALLNRPFPTSGKVIDLTPPDEEDEDEERPRHAPKRRRPRGQKSGPRPPAR
jgi:hypothetical protein